MGVLASPSIGVALAAVLDGGAGEEEEANEKGEAGDGAADDAGDLTGWEMVFVGFDGS